MTWKCRLPLRSWSLSPQLWKARMRRPSISPCVLTNIILKLNVLFHIKKIDLNWVWMSCWWIQRISLFTNRPFLRKKLMKDSSNSWNPTSMTIRWTMMSKWRPSPSSISRLWRNWNPWPTRWDCLRISPSVWATIMTFTKFMRKGNSNCFP